MKQAPALRLKKRPKNQDMKKVLFTRFMLIVAVFLLWIGGISVRLVHLQINQHAYLLAKATNQRLNVKKTKLMRGTIYDRNGSVLAMSVPVRTLYADPTEMADVDTAARQIAKVAGLNSQQLASQLNQAKADGKRYLSLAKRLDDDTFRRINKALFNPEVKKSDEPKFAGLHWEEDQKRSYPYRSLASQTLGFANADDQGMAGIEQSKNALLEGDLIKNIQERDRLGRVYDERVDDPEPPKDIVLTIDKSIQLVTEEALAQGVANANARAGMAIVLDPKTGDILAIANAPSFDPENLRAGTANAANNAIQSVYSPGSVFKLVTYSSALEKNLFKPTDMIDAGDGTIEVAGHKFTDSHHVGRVNYAEALAHSSNVCAIKTGLRVGKTDFYEMVKKMGFGSRTGVELPAETAGIVRNPDRWNGDSLASMSIGYEIGVTPLQMATAFATIANDGIKNQPHIIKEIRDSEGNTISISEPNQSQVVSAETARNLRTMLRQVVLTGTGRRAQLDGYTSAGKTGTAWKFDPKTKRVERSKYMSTFIGFAPVENPKFVVAVVMDEPMSGARDGGAVSAPVFKVIAQRLLENANAPHDLVTGESQTVAQEIPEVASDEPNVKGPPPEDKTDRKADESKPGKKTERPIRTEQTKPAAADKTTNTNQVVKPVSNTPALWKTKPKT
jgi:cell division protein FtsI (penicillin-binding protein 3)